MTIDIDAEFADLDSRYPGSKRKRREPAPVVEASEGWDAHPLIKFMGGREVEFFTIGALAGALGKSVITIRRWERMSFIPQSPYRLPSHKRGDSTMPGKRVFTRPLITAAVEEFDKRGLLGAARVEWKEHDDLTTALVARWLAITTA